MIRPCCLAVLLTPLLCTFSHTATMHVPSGQPTIQVGIDAALDGDTVLVASGSCPSDYYVLPTACGEYPVAEPSRKTPIVCRFGDRFCQWEGAYF